MSAPFTTRFQRLIFLYQPISSNNKMLTPVVRGPSASIGSSHRLSPTPTFLVQISVTTLFLLELSRNFEAGPLHYLLP